MDLSFLDGNGLVMMWLCGGGGDDDDE